MILLKFVVISITLLITYNFAQIVSRIRKIPHLNRVLRHRIQDRIIQYRERNTEHICYDEVGCFSLPHSKSPLQKAPESPKVINTRFYLFNRKINFSTPEVINFYKGQAKVNDTKFDTNLPLKMVIHGYMSKWNEKGNILMASTYLKLYNCNVILVDWQNGARGPQYPIAAANTEVVGRVVGFLLLDLVNRGLKTKNIHLIGFSLGAHVAGTASEVLKKRHHLIQRITGLDAASPLFRSDHLREKYKKLDKEDAVFVDVLHTDASPSVTDGFGLWEPIGDVDFFANGGQQQPGCTDTQDSIVVSTFERTLTREIACSHIRAFHLFLESLFNKLNGTCEFIAYSCPGGLTSYEKGRCFPELASNKSIDLHPSYRTEIGRFGEDVRGEGVMYFSTTDSTPFCGSQLQAIVEIVEQYANIEGTLILQINYLHYAVRFQIPTGNGKFKNLALVKGYGVAPYKTLLNEIDEIDADLYFLLTPTEEETVIITDLYLNSVRVKDMYGKSWQFCKRNTLIKDKGKIKFKLNKNTICK